MPALEAEFPGIRRQILEHHLRYTFVRFGVPYMVSVICFDASVPRYRMPTCRTADKVAQRFLRALRVAGGAPRHPHAARLLPVERPAKLSESFTYASPGRILSGTGFRGQGGRADYTVYSQIRFPIANAPAFAGSQMYRIRNPEAGGKRPATPIRGATISASAAGFQSARSAGVGHQGQDIRPHRCKPPTAPSAASTTISGRGARWRDPPLARQEAAYLFVNSASEHIRFRYLHMNPRKMDEDNLLSGRRVYEGEVIGQISNYSIKEGGTSYHLHFDVQVPTKDGWVFVNPYMTLVAAYERLIGERGTELGTPTLVSSADADLSATIGRAVQVEPISKRAKTVRHKGKAKKYRPASPGIDATPVCGRDRRF